MSWNPIRARRDRREVELGTLEAYRTARRLVNEDVTVFGEQLSELHVDTLTTELDDGMRDDYRMALERYDEAKVALRDAETSEGVAAVDELLTDGRFHLACVLAARDGRERPARREPCFFNPQHGPASKDVLWAPPNGVERTVPVCFRDAERLAGHEEPDVRLVRVGDRWMPWYAAGGSIDAVARQNAHIIHSRMGSVSRTEKHTAEALTRAGTDDIGSWGG